MAILYLGIFGDIFYLLLCGCGVGYSVQWEHVDQLPPIKVINKREVMHHVIADTIEGWGHAIHALVQSYLVGYWVEFDYSSIRPEGTPLLTSGGVAPGHLGLRRCLESVRRILDRATGRRLRPIECHDILCHIATAVLSGGIRRAAMIALFSPNDTEMMYAKTHGNFDPSGVNQQRALANNSVALLREAPDTRAVFEKVVRLSVEGWGEPGFFFTEHLDYGPNPCGEIGLWPVSVKGQSGFAFCNLVEINAAKIMSEDDALGCAWAASLIATLQSTYTDIPFLKDGTADIFREQQLIGVGLTGIMDNPQLLEGMMLVRMHKKVCETNNFFANKLGIMTSPKLRSCCVKPSGTASLELGGVANGIHPQHARRYFRRVTANPNEQAAQYFRSINPHMVEEKPNGDWCITFPVEATGSSIIKSDITWKRHIEIITQVYRDWICGGESSLSLFTHNISCTLIVPRDNIESAITEIWHRREVIAAMSFASPTIDKLYPFAPFEEVDKETEGKWNALLLLQQCVNWEGLRERVSEGNLQKTLACEGGHCDLVEDNERPISSSYL